MIASGILRSLAIIGCAALLTASCGLSSTPAQPGISRPRIAEATQLAQLDVGHQAVFSRCIPPACPTRSPKTLSPETAGQSITSVAQAAASTMEFSRTVIVQFAPGSTRLNSVGRFSLDEAASNLLSAHRITITGRTDSKGEMAFNEQLALARAYKVRDYLRNKHPMLTAKIAVQAQGACCFIASNDTVSGRARNRRVEVVFQTNEAGRT